MPQPSKRQQIRRVFIVTLALNLVVALGKIVLGALTGALAISADGFHSLTDGAGNITGLIALRYADLPPDDDHPYGHQRFEALAALFIAGLLLLTAWELLTSLFDRLGATANPQVNGVALLVLGVTLAINIGVNAYQTRAGKRLHSALLLADAKHTGADILVTLSVMGSSALVALTGWAWLDVVAALLVGGLIMRTAWQIARETGRVLADTAPYAPQAICAALHGVEGIERIVRVRSRGDGAAALIDVDVAAAPSLTIAQSEGIARTIRQRLEAQFGTLAEVEVHFSAA